MAHVTSKLALNSSRARLDKISEQEKNECLIYVDRGSPFYSYLNGTQ